MKLRVYLGFILAVILVLVIGVNSYSTFKEQQTEAVKLRHSYVMLSQMQKLQSLLVDMETGRRGFRSTNEKRFLEPYKAGLLQIDPSIQALRQMTTEPAIAAKIPRLQSSINSILIFWKGIGEDATNFSKDYVTSLMDQEKRLMDVIRREITDITRIEQDALMKLEYENAAAVRAATRALVASIILIIIIVVVLIYIILKEFRTRKKAQLELTENNQRLELVHKESSERNWILEGVSRINDSMHGKTEPAELSQSLLDAIIDYLQIEAGGFYTFVNDEQVLKLKGSRGLSRDVKATYKPGEGLIGEIAQNKKTEIRNNIPADHVVIDASGKSLEGLYMPIYSNDELKAVVELITLKSFSEQHQKLLNVVCSNIGIAINSAQASKSVLQLLKQVQEQTETLVQQQEELRQANEELTHQAEGLQHSEEELKVQEEELRQINAELEEKNEAIETARQAFELKANELEVTSKYKSEFLANMSHELRTPLNSVLILAKLLAENKEHTLTDKQVSHAKIIHKSGSDLLQLINEILDLSKIEAGKIEMHFENVPVKNIAEDIEQLFQVMAEERQIRFKVNVDDNVPETVQTDKQRLEQVLKNMLSNAFKFTEPDGEITFDMRLAVEGTKPLLEMIVSDNGIGISPMRQQGIFEAFQQADGATNRKYGGTGLGLSISKELVRMLGGMIAVESEEGRGSIFKVIIPLFKTIIRDDSKEGRRLPQQPTYGGAISPTIVDDRFDIKAGDKVLLVIEDDDTFAKIVRQFGFSHGFKTMLALNGAEGLQLAKKYKPGAIILDIHLPDIDGGTVLQMIKNDKELKDIPVHIISAKEDMAVLPGAFAYLQKPLSKKDLDNVFLLIGEIMKGAIKKVLLISGGNLKDNMLNTLITNRQLDVQCDIAVSVDEAIEMIKAVKYDCVIADIGKNVSQGIASLKILSEHLKQQVPVIIYLDEDITPGDDLQLKKISDVVVRSSSSSPERLMDELELFLYKVEQDRGHSPEPTSKDARVLGDQALKGRKALLVDDDMRNIFALTAALEPEQMEIHTASDGKEALQVLMDVPSIDIVLMDIMMPNMDGYQAMTHIRKEMALTDIPIIALTAKAMSEDKEKCIAAGASDYISKPVDIQKLKSLMRVWLSQ